MAIERAAGGMNDDVGARVVSRCRDMGFACAGISDAAPSRFGAEMRAWLAAGKHGTMSYLAEQVEARLDASRVLEGVRSIVMVADQYAARGDDDVAWGLPGPERPHGRYEGTVARYARGRDYHRVIRARLHALSDELEREFPGERFRTCVDLLPLLEREYASRAGLGWIGKHTLLIHPVIGSYTLLGALLTTMRIEPARDQRVAADACGTCTRCIDACPTRAISAYSVDASRCITYLTVEHREEIPREFHGAIGDWMIGCDVCQEACPHNSPRGAGVDVGRVHPEYAPRRGSLDALRVLAWSEADRENETFGTPIARASLEMLKRNALIVLGNLVRRDAESTSSDSGVSDPAQDARRAAIERVRQASLDPRESELVRRTALEVLASIEDS
jgi:epoxyqueuosine reductase